MLPKNFGGFKEWLENNWTYFGCKERLKDFYNEVRIAIIEYIDSHKKDLQRYINNQTDSQNKPLRNELKKQSNFLINNYRLAIENVYKDVVKKKGERMRIDESNRVQTLSELITIVLNIYKNTCETKKQAIATKTKSTQTNNSNDNSAEKEDKSSYYCEELNKILEFDDLFSPSQQYIAAIERQIQQLIIYMDEGNSKKIISEKGIINPKYIIMMRAEVIKALYMNSQEAYHLAIIFSLEIYRTQVSGKYDRCNISCKLTEEQPLTLEETNLYIRLEEACDNISDILHNFIRSEKSKPEDKEDPVATNQQAVQSVNKPKKKPLNVSKPLRTLRLEDKSESQVVTAKPESIMVLCLQDIMKKHPVRPESSIPSGPSGQLVASIRPLHLFRQVPSAQPVPLALLGTQVLSQTKGCTEIEHSTSIVLSSTDSPVILIIPRYIRIPSYIKAPKEALYFHTVMPTSSDDNLTKDMVIACMQALLMPLFTAYNRTSNNISIEMKAKTQLNELIKNIKKRWDLFVDKQTLGAFYD